MLLIFRSRRVFFISQKIRDGKVFENHEAFVRGNQIKEFLTNEGKEFGNEQAKTFLQTKGIDFRTTMPYTPKQNGDTLRKKQSSSH